jgi:isoleucyl-tRNA synthetase
MELPNFAHFLDALAPGILFAQAIGRFGNWLENLVDWNLSRSRYWGTPLPIWRTEDGLEEKCIGSKAELTAEFEKAVKAGFNVNSKFKV